MFEKDMRDKLNAELGFNKTKISSDSGRKYNDRKNRGYSMVPLYRAAKVEYEDTDDFRVILDMKLESLLANGKKGTLKELLRDNIKEIIKGDYYDVDDMVCKIEDYVKQRKLALNIARKEGFNAVRKINFVINEFAAAYSKYLGGYKKFVGLTAAKNSIINALNKLGYDVSEKELFEELKYYYDKNSREIAAQEILKDTREKNLYVAMLIAKNLMKRNNLNLDLYEILEVREVEEGINEDNIIENKNTIEDVQHIEVHEEVEDDILNTRLIELEKKIAKLEEELEIERLMNQEEKTKMVEEITTLRNEKLENIEYAKSQYKNAMESVVKVLNDKSYGFVLDELYRYSKGYVEKINHKAIISNLLVALQSIGIRAVEKNKFNSRVVLQNDSMYKFRFNKGLDVYKDVEALIKAPAWFYKNEELIKEFIEVKER